MDAHHKFMFGIHISCVQEKNWTSCFSCMNVQDVYRDVNLHFVESSTLAPPEVHIDIVAQQAVSAFQLNGLMLQFLVYCVCLFGL
jgi:hypothetical protein